MLQKLKQKIFHCIRLGLGDEGYIPNVELFQAPIMRWINIKSVSGETALESGGEVNAKNLVARITGQNPFSENDRCYIYHHPPDEFDPLCNDADYRVSTVLPGHMVTEVIFEKRI